MKCVKPSSPIQRLRSKEIDVVSTRINDLREQLCSSNLTPRDREWIGELIADWRWRLALLLGERHPTT